jgi:transcriptional regulator with XRE-family HTH domain
MIDPVLVGIGKKIRKIRQEKLIKLHELAEEAQISKGLLSKIENSRTIPSLPVLISIIKSLKEEMSSFFEGIDINGNNSVIYKKKSEYYTFEKEEALGFIYHFILEKTLSDFTIEAVILELLPHSQREQVTTDGYEFKYILKGEVEYHLSEEIIKLEEGDSILFNGNIPHVPVNNSEQAVSMLVIYLLLPKQS